MLTVKKPISTVISSDFVNTGEGFAARISANYSMMESQLFPEDLLHLVTQPPEVFVMGGEGGSMFSQTNIESAQITKVNITNNLVNRILMAADGNFTYQDNVYITNVLHKLGIHDDSRFMEQVFKLTQENRETTNLLHTYEQNSTRLKNLIANYRQETDDSSHVQNTQLTEVRNDVLYLHETVNRRWQTGTDVSIMQSFLTSGPASKIITENLYHISEQAGFFEQLRINELRSEVRGEYVPMLYHKMNIYEGNDITTTEYDDRRIDGRINAAVLLNMVSNIYKSIEDRRDTRTDQWYRVESLFYRAGDVTLRRMLSNTQYLQTLYDRDQLLLQTTTNYGQEQQLINNILEQSSQLEQTVNVEQGGDRIFEGADMILNLANVEGDINEEISRTEVNISDDTTAVTQNNLLRERIDRLQKQEEQASLPVEAGDTYEQTQLVKNVSETTEEITESADTRNTLEQQLYQINLKNEQRQKEYIQNLQNLVEEYNEAPRERPSAEQIRQQSILALEHPETFISQFNEAAVEDETREQEFARRAEELLPKETRVIFDIVREYLENPNRNTDGPRVTVNNAAMLYYDSIHEGDTTENLIEESGTLIQTERERVREYYEQAKGAAQQADEEIQALDNLILHPIDTGNGGAGDGGEVPNELVQFVRGELSEIVQEKIVREREETERRIETEVKSPAARVSERVSPESVSFVHRTTQTGISEETIENLREEIKRVENTKRTTTESVQNVDTVEHRVVNNNTQTFVNEEANEARIVNIVDQNLSGRIDDISNRVYAKIERQLDSERRRRGL